MPKFSIIIPTFNRDKHIVKTIKSVLNQTFQDFEVLIIDDGSTDRTTSVVQSFEDERLLYFFKKNEERGAARNFGVLKASGTFITFLDSDDVLYSDHLSIANNFSIQHPNQVFWQGYDVMDEQDNLIKKHARSNGTILDNLINEGNIMACMGVFLPIEIMKNNLFIEDRKLAGSEDMELWIRIALKHPILKVNHSTGAMINHADRSVLDVDFEKLENRKLLMLQHVFKSKDPILQKSKNKIISNAYSYIALHGVLAKNSQSKVSSKYLINSIRIFPQAIFKKRTWAIIKRLLV